MMKPLDELAAALAEIAVLRAALTEARREAEALRVARDVALRLSVWPPPRVLVSLHGDPEHERD